jgi:hypothetical protein
MNHDHPAPASTCAGMLSTVPHSLNVTILVVYLFCVVWNAEAQVLTVSL